MKVLSCWWIWLLSGTKHAKDLRNFIAGTDQPPWYVRNDKFGFRCNSWIKLIPRIFPNLCSIWNPSNARPKKISPSVSSFLIIKYIHFTSITALQSPIAYQKSGLDTLDCTRSAHTRTKSTGDQTDSNFLSAPQQNSSATVNTLPVQRKSSLFDSLRSKKTKSVSSSSSNGGGKSSVSIRWDVRPLQYCVKTSWSVLVGKHSGFMTKAIYFYKSCIQCGYFLCYCRIVRNLFIVYLGILRPIFVILFVLICSLRNQVTKLLGSGYQSANLRSYTMHWMMICV